MKNLQKTLAVIVAASLSVIISCSPPQPETRQQAKSHVVNPQWSISANIYEVNTRQFTDEGTFKAFRQHLPRLRNMGVDILWFMPITPIGEVNRKGSLGSYYSVKDYKAVNPEFGSLQDFKDLVAEAHNLGMYVILDWVANHTAWDNYLVNEKPDWFSRDSVGELISPFDWSDVVQLNYDVPEVWDYMIDAMKFWVKDVNVDGFRCDVAFLVPTEFWNRARLELDEIKPVFMLAEAEEPELNEFAFDASYGWAMHHVMNQVAAGTKTANSIDSLILLNQKEFPLGTILMHFTSNHDENSWASTEFTRLGDGTLTFAALKATIPGMPLIYSGQEAANDKMLEFFEKDVIDWSEIPYEGFYRELLSLKHNNMALWNGMHGGSYQRIHTNQDKEVLAFMRVLGHSKVFVVLNLSGQLIKTTLKGDAFAGEYKTAFTYEKLEFIAGEQITLAPWEYRIYYH